jgi:hypothetical protein
MDDFKGYPIFQYSVFIKNGKDAQFVIRANTYDEFISAKKDLDKILNAMGAHETTESPATQTTPQAMTRPCVKEGCQGTQTYKTGISKKTGRTWKAWMCDLSAEHTDWLK